MTRSATVLISLINFTAGVPYNNHNSRYDERQRCTVFLTQDDFNFGQSDDEKDKKKPKFNPSGLNTNQNTPAMSAMNTNVWGTGGAARTGTSAQLTLGGSRTGFSNKEV